MNVGRLQFLQLSHHLRKLHETVPTLHNFIHTKHRTRRPMRFDECDFLLILSAFYGFERLLVDLIFQLDAAGRFV